MLDVSIRIGLLNLMAELRERGGRLVPLHHPRHRQRPVRRRPADGHVRRAHRRVRPDRGACWPTRSTRTRSCCCRRCPTRGRRWRCDGGRPRRAAAGHRPERRAAGSAGAARWRSSSASRSRRCPGSWRPGTARPATWPDRVGGGLGEDRGHRRRQHVHARADRGVRPPGRRARGRRAGAAGRRRRPARGRRRPGPADPGRTAVPRPAGHHDLAGVRGGRCGGRAGPAAGRRPARPGWSTRRCPAGSGCSARRPPARAGSPRRCGPCRSCSTSPTPSRSWPGRTPGSSTSPTRSASSPGRCSTPGTARSGCATSRSGSSAGWPPASASSRTGSGSATPASTT